MPQISGCQLANQIIKINQKIKMVITTAYDDVIYKSLNLEIVKKPVTIKNIVEVVQQYKNYQ